MATRTEIIKKVLEKLNVIAEGDSPSADDTTTVGEYYDALLATLTERHVITWGASDEVPDDSVVPIVTIVAADCADFYAVEPQRVSRLMAAAYGPDVGGRICAMTMLSQLAAAEYVDSPTEAEYF